MALAPPVVAFAPPADLAVPEADFIAEPDFAAEPDFGFAAIEADVDAPLVLPADFPAVLAEALPAVLAEALAGALLARAGAAVLGAALLVLFEAPAFAAGLAVPVSLADVFLTVFMTAPAASVTLSAALVITLFAMTSSRFLWRRLCVINLT
jgi:hypothetical protein